MPLYEYVCSDCGAFFEYWVRSASSKEEIICPECKGVWLDRGELEKLMTVADEEEFEFERRVVSGRRRDDDDDDDRRRSSDDRERRRYEDDRRRSDDDEYYRRGSQRKKKSWFSQMMEAVGGEEGD